MEAADSNTKAFKATEPLIHKFSRQASKPKLAKLYYRCGRGSHSPTECRFREATCHHCNKKGHIAPVCRSKTKEQKRTSKCTGGHKQGQHRANHVHEDAPSLVLDTSASSGDEYHLHLMDECSSHPITVDVFVNRRPLSMEVDTGAAVSIISENTRQTLFAGLKLHRTILCLKTYTEEYMQVTGQLRVVVQYGKQQEKLVLIVVAGNGPSLFGRNWLKYLQLDWSTIATVNTVRGKSLQALLKEHPQLLAEGLGKVGRVSSYITVQFYKYADKHHATRFAKKYLCSP